MIRFISLLYIIMAAWTAQAAIFSSPGLQRTEFLLFHALHLPQEDLDWIEQSGIIPNGKMWADSLRRSDGFVHYADMAGLTGDVIEAYRRQGLMNSPEIPYLLYLSASSKDFLYDYEGCNNDFDLLEQTIERSNISSADKRAWELILALDKPLYNTSRSEFLGFWIQRDIAMFMETNPNIDDRLYLILYEKIISGILNSVYYVEKRITDRYLRKIKEIIEQKWEPIADEILNALNPSTFMAAIASNPEFASLPVSALERAIRSGTVHPQTLYLAYITLSNYYGATNNPTESIQYQKRADQQAISLAEGRKEISIANGLADMVSLFAAFQSYSTERSDLEKAAYDKIRNNVDTTDVKSRRSYLWIIDQFAKNRIGNSSQLSGVEIARDFFSIAKREPFHTAYFGFYLSSVSQLANGGQVDEARSALNEITDLANPREHFLLQYMAADLTSNFSMDFEQAYNQTKEALSLLEEVEDASPAEYKDLYYRLLVLSISNKRHDDIETWIAAINKLKKEMQIEDFECPEDWSIALYKSESIYPVKKRISYLKDLATKAEKHGNIHAMKSIQYQLAKEYYLERDIPNVEKHLEMAVVIDNNLGNGTIDFLLYNDWLNFLHNKKSDRAEWRKELSSLVAIAEDYQLDVNLGFLNLLAWQLSNVIQTSNVDDSAFLSSIIMEKAAKIQGICKGDPFATQQLVNIMLPIFSNYSMTTFNIMQNCSDEKKKQEYRLHLDNYRQMVDNYFTDDSEFIKFNSLKSPDQYLNNQIALAWIDLAVRGTDASMDRLGALMKWAEENKMDAAFLNQSHSLRLRIAMLQNDYEMIEGLLDYDMSMLEKGAISVDEASFVLNSLITVHLNRKDFAGAFPLAKRRFEIVREFIDNQFMDLSESQRIALFDNGTASTIMLNKVLRENPSPEATTTAYNASLYFKNLLLSSSNALRRAVYASGDSLQVSEYERLLMLRNEISQKSAGMIDDQSEMLRLYRQAKALEDSVSDRALRSGLISARKTFTFKDVVKQLKRDEAAIEFVMDDERFGALIARKGYKSPVYVPIISGQDLHRLLSLSERGSLKNGLKMLYNRNKSGKELYDSVWQPIEPHLEGVKTIYYVPEGELHRLSFAALQDSTGASLCQLYDMRLSSSTGNLVEKALRRKRDSKKSDKLFSCVALGDVIYDADSTKNPRRRGAWKYLNNTALEIATFDSLCRQSNINPTLLTKLAPSEDAFRTTIGDAPDLILMATHGFYLNNNDAKALPYYERQVTSGEDNSNVNLSPMIRSGLVLADANPAWVNEEMRESVHDGILTAAEISELNLTNTNLVILSACQTALGETLHLNGVNGVQRGFKIAGVGSIVMTLWEVDDRAGREFMKEFFTNLFSTGDRHEAFQKARLIQMQRYPQNPFYWAPFVMLD